MKIRGGSSMGHGCTNVCPKISVVFFVYIGIYDRYTIQAQYDYFSKACGQQQPIGFVPLHLIVLFF